MKRGAQKESSSVVAGILGFLKDSGKSNLLTSVAEVLDEAAGKTKQANRIVIASAVRLNPQELARLKGAVSVFLKTTLPTTNVIDKTLIAGFSIRVGDFFLDASLGAEVDSIKNLLVT